MLHLREVRRRATRSTPLAQHPSLNTLAHAPHTTDVSPERSPVSSQGLLWSPRRKGEGHFKLRGKLPDCEETKDSGSQAYLLRERRQVQKRGCPSRPPSLGGAHSGNRDTVVALCHNKVSAGDGLMRGELMRPVRLRERCLGRVFR